MEAQEVVTMGKTKRVSALSGRIAAGKADPIRPEERRIVAGFRKSYEQKFGTPKQRPSDISTVVRSKGRNSGTAVTNSK